MINVLKQIIKNRLLVLRDPELQEVKRLIGKGKKLARYADSHIKECNDVFLRRLVSNPQALKMSFWEDHFEWPSIETYPELKGRILDFGCGSGHLDVMLARKGRVVHGIDLSPIGIMIANNQRSKEDSTVQSRLSFQVADVTRVKPADELFDSAWSAHVFEHISDPRPVLEGIRKWLKPDGHLLISVPFGNAYDDPGHVNHFFSAKDIESYLNGFVSIKRIDIEMEFQVIRVLCTFS